MDGLKPEAVILAEGLINLARENSIELRITRGYINLEQQAVLYAQGRTKPGPKVTAVKRSVHNTGLAFDVVVVENGSYTWKRDKLEIVGELGTRLGLVWGGDFQHKDYSHFETANAKEMLRELATN